MVSRRLENLLCGANECLPYPFGRFSCIRAFLSSVLQSLHLSYQDCRCCAQSRLLMVTRVPIPRVFLLGSGATVVKTGLHQT